MPRRLLLLLAAAAAALTLVPTAASAAPARRAETIALPAGSQPEGITSGPGSTYYAGSRRDGSITTGDLRTGSSRLLVPGTPGGIAVGMRYDARTGRLYVAGGTTGAVTVYDAATGAQLARYQVPGSRFLNDVEVTRSAVYVTDSLHPELVVLDLGRRHSLPAAPRLLPLSGDFVQTPGLNANGIRALPGGDLLVTQSSTGGLFTVDPGTGTATRVQQLGTPLVSGDGLVLHGRTLYVLNGFGGTGNDIAVVHLGRHARTARVVGSLTDPDVDRATTGVLAAGALYVVNGRFSTPPTPDRAYAVVRVDLHRHH